MVSITSSPIDMTSLLRELPDPSSGGTTIFVGTVRNHSQGKAVRLLEYTAYVPMAEKLMKEIEQEIKSKWQVQNVVMVHRLGILAIGDIAVVTAVACAHRREAFDACRYAIDRVKEVVPIWKREEWD